MFRYHTYAACIGLGIAVALAMTPGVIGLARRFGALDRPQHRKAHHKPVPLWGGLAVFVGMWTPLLLLLCYDNAVARQLQDQWASLALIFGAGLTMLGVGMFDDLRGLNAWQKLLVQLPVALVLLSFGVQIGGVTVPGLGSLSLGPLASLVTLLWLVGITNAINLIDGVDGLAAGVTLFVAVVNAVVATIHGHALLACVMFSLAGASLGFLCFNFNPARIFLGDAGSLFLGMTLATSSVLCNTKGTVAASLLIPLVALGYPVIDTLLSMGRRALRGKSMFSGDNGHIHHRLLHRGLSPRKTVLVLYGACLVCCGVALAMVFENRAGTAIGLVVLGVVLALGLRSLGYLDGLKEALTNPSVRPRRGRFRLVHHEAEAMKARIDLAQTPGEVFSLLRAACLELGLAALTIRSGHLATVEGNGRLAAGVIGVSREGGGEPSGEPVQVWWSEAFERAGGGVSGPVAVACDEYAFENTGLVVEVGYLASNGDDDLLLESRMRMGEVVQAANARLGSLSGCASSAVAQPRRLAPAALIKWVRRSLAGSA